MKLSKRDLVVSPDLPNSMVGGSVGFDELVKSPYQLYKAIIMITRCAFGSMVIGDKTYRSDLIVYPDGKVADNWWRKSGHRLTLEDIQDLLAAKPEVIVAGTGIYGRMQVPTDVQNALVQQGIELIALETKPAVKEFNRIKQTAKSVAGCFHLTC